MCLAALYIVGLCIWSLLEHETLSHRICPIKQCRELKRESRKRSNGHEHQSIKSVSVLHFDINLTSDIVIIELYIYV